MDRSRLIGSYLSALNDGTHVTPYGHGWLLTTPMRFYDDDRVTLFVEAFEQGFRVTDQGTTAVRLAMADVNMDSPRVADAWRRSTAALDEFSFGAEEGVISANGHLDDLGSIILRVSEAAMRVDQLRWLTLDRKAAKLPDRVVSHLRGMFAGPEVVTPRAPIRLSSGRLRQVTAAIGNNESNRLYVQAVANGGRETRDRSVEHCAYLFTMALNLPRERKVVVAGGSSRDWPSEIISELESVSDVTFFGEPATMDPLISKRAKAALV